MTRRTSLLTLTVAVGIFLGAAPGVMAEEWTSKATLWAGTSEDSTVEVTDLHARRLESGLDELVVGGHDQLGSESTVVVTQWIPEHYFDAQGAVGQAPRVDHCGDTIGVAYAREVGSARSVQMGPFDDLELYPVEATGVAFSRPDIACAEPARQAVTYLRKDASGLHVQMFTFDANWLVDDLNDGADLGVASKGSTPAIAATPGFIHVAWKSGTKLRYKRFTVGAGPDHAITPLPTTTLDTSSSLDELRLGADGKRVVIAWERGSDVVARVSTDQGASWKPRATIFRGGGPAKADAAVTNADVRGKTIIVSGTVWTCFEGCGGTGSIKRTTTNGGSWAKVKGSTIRGGYVFGALAGERSAPSMFMAWDQRFNLIPVIKVRYAP